MIRPSPYADYYMPQEPSRRRFPLWGWAPYAVIALLAGVWAVTHWGAVISGASSPKAIAFGVAALGLAALLLLGVAWLTGRGWAGQLAGILPLMAAAAVAVLPSYLPTTVDDAAPEGVVAAPSDPAASSSSPAPAGIPVGTGAPPTTPPTSSAPAAPVELGSAAFVGIDHDVTGVARLIQLEDGSWLVRFEQFDVEPGPDYDVYLLTGDSVAQPDGGTALGDLRGTTGNQNYDVPGGSLPSDGQPVTVLIWCELFDVPVANATVQF